MARLKNTTVNGSLTIKANNKNMEVGCGRSDTYISNSKAGSYLQLKDNGEIHYNNNNIYHEGNKPSLSSLGAASSNHSHGLLHDNFTVEISNTTTDSGWNMINNSYRGFILKSIRTSESAPSWLLGDFAAGIAFGGADTKGVMSISYNKARVRFAGGNGSKPVWYFSINGNSSQVYELEDLRNATNSNNANRIVKRDGSGNFSAGTITASLSGNATSATKLATARSINGTNFDGTGNITTANWGTARTITIGKTGKSINGSGNVSYSLSEIGALEAGKTAIGNSEFTSTSRSVTVNLGLTMPNATYHVTITPTSNPSGGLGEVYISSRTTTSFVVNTSGSANFTFSWIAISK